MANYKWEIDKSFNFEMGHLVSKQQLNHPSLSIETDCCCKRLHGHSYEIKVFLGADSLDQSEMVSDFKNLNFMKVFLDSTLDHRFMIDINDPNFELVTSIKPERVATAKNFTLLSNIMVATSDAQQLHIDSFVLVNFCPTSENICKYLKEYAQEQLGSVAKVTALELWETKKSHCRYTG
jgi:6-pyruvoyltetrahydropterin/6-carboxytetrahydropterin synthase